MHRRIAVLFSIWGRILAWCVVAMTVGAILYFLIGDVVTPSPIDFGITVVFGLGGGVFFGILTGVIDGFILGTLVAFGDFQTNSSMGERWLLRGVSAVVTAICVALVMSVINKYVILPTVIAAIGGWLVAQRVLAHESRKQKNDGAIAA